MKYVPVDVVFTKFEHFVDLSHTEDEGDTFPSWSSDFKLKVPSLRFYYTQCAVKLAIYIFIGTLQRQ
jgi:hypothetical protein